MKKKIVFILVLLTGLWLTADDSQLIRHLQQTVKAADAFALVETLASPEYEGRLTGSDGYNKAARLAADYFKKHGVQPLGSDYFQSFPMEYTKVYESALTFRFKNEKGEDETLKCDYFKDFYPLGFSGSGQAKAQVVFAGYGMTAPEYGYDNYKDIDVKGKVVLLMKGVPKAKKGEDWLKYDDHRYRTRNAKNHGAAALVYIHGAMANPNGIHLENFPMVSIKKELADRLLKPYGKSLKTLREAINARETVAFAMDMEAEVMVRSERFKRSGLNVVGYIPGSHETLKHECIVIGSHLDHCGMWPALTPGADDNASGSAVLMTIAKALAEAPVKPKRSIVFVLFAGEEMGLLGSTYFASHLPAPLNQISFVINMDMVGAGPNVFVLRMKNYPDFEKVVTAVPGTLGLSSRIRGNKVTRKRRGGADHAPFVEKGIPAVSVFSSGGKHHGYHSNEDTIYWITPKIMEDIAKIISYTAIKLANH